MKVGDWVEVRTRSEIYATLDERSQLDGMPFMPEMLAHCGRRFRVLKVAHKACDTVFPVRTRSIARAVHLGTRCDGSGHGGCQAGCLIYWKEDWLKPVASGSNDENRIDPPRPPTLMQGAADKGAETILSNARRLNESGEQVFVCQATQLPYASTQLAWWDIRQYVRDYSSGNISLARMIAGFSFAAYYRLSEAGIGIGRPMRWLYNKIYGWWDGSIWPKTKGAIPPGQSTPGLALDLQPGELVRVRPLAEILKTVTIDYKNRGLVWDPEMAPYCGKTYRVLKRVTQIIDEKSGRMMQMKNPCIILDSVICEGRYNGCRIFCPRSIYSYWREIWLERIPAERENLTENTIAQQASQH